MSSLPAALRSGDFWSELLSDDAGQLDSEAVAILSLALAARKCARVVRGSNPIWYRKDPQENNKDGRLKNVVLTISTRIVDDLNCNASMKRPRVKIICDDFTTYGIDGPFDLCLTSPPYLTRLDYVVAHLPELTVLGHVAPIDIDALRSLMIGTTKIVSKENTAVPDEWGILCKTALNTIQNHGSYASKRYYYFTYQQYFDRLYDLLRNLSLTLGRHSQGLIVLQDSYYKDINIQTPQIASEMLRNLHWQTTIVRRQTVKAHMGRLSPKQSEYAPIKTLRECLLHFYR